ncbi:MAG: ABC transporter permease, partial [Blastocatellia bacterium]|nr:ABC transporter permease [Blastocatellia bacterium]
VSGNYFSVLGVNAVIGRTLTEADDDPANAQPAAVISYEFWKRRFGLDPKVVGKKITINDTAFEIVGVAPRGFFGCEIGARPDLWSPIRASNDPMLRQETSYWIRVLGRLRQGVSMEQAQAEMDLIVRQQPSEAVYVRRSAISLRLEAGGAGYTGLREQFQQPLMILMMTVALVLLIACSNVANLLLARAASRRKEIAMRLALGASRFRLIRQLLTESLLLAMIGGIAGLLFARLCARALLTYLPLQTQAALDIAPDAGVLGFTLAISALTGLLFGLAPALQATRIDLTASLKDQAGASASRSRLALNKLLVVTQVALSVFLLIGAGLFVRSLRNLRGIDTVFNYENIVRFNIDPGSGYNLAQRMGLYREMLAHLEALPGARSATLSDFDLVGRNLSGDRVTIPGYTPAPGENMNCYILKVGPRFFETMKMPILAGRDFGPQDDRPANQQAATQNNSSTPLLHAVINETMASRFFRNGNPVGKRFSQRGREMEIIGVVKGAKYKSLRDPSQPTFFLYSFEQPSQFGMTFQLRTDSDKIDYAAAIQRLAREIDPQLQVFNLKTLTEVVDETLVQERFVAQVASAFSLLALLLTCVGLYGVMSYTVTRRTSEIGIRMALGAQKVDVIRLVMREVLLLVTVGAVIGLAAALGTTRYVAAFLFGLTPNDPMTITLATLLLIGVAALAGYLPARRATKVDPLVALRCE